MLGTITISLTLLLGMVLSVLPLPDFVPPELGFVRPDWVAMVLIYWILALPHRVGLITAWIAGLGMDVLLGTLLGQHALSYLSLIHI